MKLMVASYNNGASDWNAEAEETRFISYKIEHEFNRPAVATIVLSDPTGALAQKYNADANDVYLGAGKVTIEDPNATDVFYGRIVKAVHNSQDHTLTLTCRDWLDQLNDEIVDYDMRVDLDGAGLRQSELHTDPDSTVNISPTYSVWSAIGGAVLEDNGVFASDTTDANDDGANDVAMLPAVPVQNQDAFLFGFNYRVHAMRLNIGTAANIDDAVWTWYYSTGAGTWTAITVTDGTNSFTETGSHEVIWTPPADWVTATYDSITKYWIKAKLGAFTAVTQIPLGTQFWEAHWSAFDDDMDWDTDEWNDKYLVPTAGMAGDIKVSTGPYDGACSATVNAGDFQSLAYDDTWVDDANPYSVWDNDESWTSDFYFRVYVGHNTPCDLYVNDSITGARIIMTTSFRDSDAGLTSTCDVEVYDNTAAGWVSVGELNVYNNARGTILTRQTIEIPEYLVDDVISSAGVAQVRFNVTRGAGVTYLIVYYIKFEVDVGTSGLTSPVLITDTPAANEVFVATDLYGTAATKLWEGVPYSIAGKIYSHINTIVTAGDAQVALTTSVESTSGISINHFEKKTRHDMLQELAEEDGSVFWLILAGTAVQWKKTTDSSSTAITDASVLRWLHGGYDFDRVYNKYTVYGIRIGTGQVEGTDSDATSIAKFKTTRSKILSLRALSDAQATDMAEALVDRDANPTFTLGAELAGLSSIRLGDYLSITSSYLGLTNAAYTVVGWTYESKTYRTTLTLEPRGTVGYSAEPRSYSAYTQAAGARERADRGDRYLPDLTTHVVS
jgi:hypothetical protein